MKKNLTPEQIAFNQAPAPRITNAVGMARLLTLALGLTIINDAHQSSDTRLDEKTAEALDKFVESRKSDQIAEALLANGVPFEQTEQEPEEIELENEDERESTIEEMEEKDFELKIALEADKELIS